MRVTPLQRAFGDEWDRIPVSFIRNEDPHLKSVTCERQATVQHPELAISTDWENEARVSREELEASREELLALNEELKASNEQLNESNADLNNANLHLQENVTQMAMQSRVLQSGAVMTLFLDRDLKLRWFTPSMQAMFSLKAGDAGRRITDFVPAFRDAQLINDIQDVLCESEAREALVSSGEGRCLLRKVFSLRIDEPRWQPWTWLARQFNYRGCWSFPVETSEGNLVNSLAMYFENPREPDQIDMELAAAFTQTAGIIIWRHLQAQPASLPG